MKDMVGLIFGRLKIVSFSHYKGSNSYWNCFCECGTTKSIRASHLLSGNTRSCSCLIRELNATRKKKCFTIEGVRNCLDCEKFFDLIYFSKDKSAIDGYQVVCKECSYFRGIKSKFNITKSEFLFLIQNQNNKCPPCGNSIEYIFSFERSDLAVDHDHKTGKVRGVVHGICNRNLIGFHTIETSKNVTKYLETHAAST